MTPEQDTRLARSLDDRTLSRNERQWIAGLAAGAGPGPIPILGRAFELARAAMTDPDARAVLGWLESVVAATRDRPAPGEEVDARAEAHFSPGDDCGRAILRLLAGAGRSVEACVFTITDDRLADGLIEAHRRGVAVRVVADDSKADDLGSDVARLDAAGIPTRVDRSPFHMHHKFAVVDGRTLLTGSYNWTRGAARDNEENLIVVDDPRLVAPFAATFEKLWAKFA